MLFNNYSILYPVIASVLGLKWKKNWQQKKIKKWTKTSKAKKRKKKTVEKVMWSFVILQSNNDYNIFVVTVSAKQKRNLSEREREREKNSPRREKFRVFVSLLTHHLSYASNIWKNRKKCESESLTTILFLARLQFTSSHCANIHRHWNERKINIIGSRRNILVNWRQLHPSETKNIEPSETEEFARAIDKERGKQPAIQPAIKLRVDKTIQNSTPHSHATEATEQQNRLG